jgi:hypothetical protein
VPPWEWACEDDEEALGLATVLGRAGVDVRTLYEPDAPTLLRTDDAEAANLLASKMLAHYARVESRERTAKLDRRDRRGLLLLALALAVLAAAAVLLGT